MTLVKLDSGDYINTEYVIKTMTDTAGSVGEKGGQLVYLVDTGYSRITESDRDRIVEAMGGEYTEDKSITMKLDHNLASEVTKVVGREISRKQMGLAH